MPFPTESTGRTLVPKKPFNMPKTMSPEVVVHTLLEPTHRPAFHITQAPIKCRHRLAKSIASVRQHDPGRRLRCLLDSDGQLKYLLRRSCRTSTRTPKIEQFARVLDKVYQEGETGFTT